MPSMQEKEADEQKVQITQESISAAAAQIIEELPKLSKEPKKIDIVEVHVKALDDIVTVNSLFTVALFLGLSLAIGNQSSLANREECNADAGISIRLIIFEVVAFACFLLSSLTAKVLKPYWNMNQQKHVMLSSIDLKDIGLSLSAVSSVAGIVLLTLSVVNVIQIQIGKLSCGYVASIVAVVCTCSIVGVALVIYVASMAVAIYKSYKWDQNHPSD